MQFEIFPTESAPYQGRTAATREASASGARAAVQDRALKVDRVRKVWRHPHTMQEVATLTGYALSSVCSLRALLGPELVEVRLQERTWPGGRTTKRAVLQLAAYAPAKTEAAS